MASCAPYSSEFTQRPPTCEPDTVILKFPCKGKDEEMFKITINNQGGDKLCYKLEGNKMDKFNAPEAMGFCEPKSSKAIELVPKAMKNSNGWNKLDNFQLTVAPAPKGDLWEPHECWKGFEHKQKKAFKSATFGPLDKIIILVAKHTIPNGPSDEDVKFWGSPKDVKTFEVHLVKVLH